MDWNTNLKSSATQSRTHEAAPTRPERRRFSPSWLSGFVASSLLLLPGCAHIENQYREDGPAINADLNSPTAADIYARYQLPPEDGRNWEPMFTQSENGAVTHGPLYFEDPFEDKGSGHTEFRLGWEDFVAMPYGYGRALLNGVALPVSMIVTPPWTEMVSDGRLSKQALGYDHDATRTDRAEEQPPPASDDAPPTEPANEMPPNSNSTGG